MKTVNVQENNTVKAKYTMERATAKIKAASSSIKQKAKSSNSAGGGDGIIVLYVILCLFPLINLIPVYLHDGSVTMNFWLTLILDLLTVIGGIIFSILVVLDVCSIA